MREKPVIKIAIKVNGGFGTVLVRANYIHCLYEYLDDEDIHIYAYGHKSSSMNDAIFKKQPSIYWYGVEKEWNTREKEKFDVIMVLDVYPDLIYANEETIKRNPRLEELVKEWNLFKNTDDNRMYFENLRKSKPYVYTQLIIQEKTVLNSADIKGILGIENDYRMPVIIKGDEKQILKKFGLEGKKFITIQRGINPKLGISETPKMWPVVYYDELVKKLKQKYPDILIVQLGESSEHCKSIEEIDVSLLGKTTWNDLKVLLKHAILHIDGECGMVHLRKSLHAGPSVVLFGSTPKAFFGYTGNINISSGACKHWCAELREDWEYNCLRGEKHAPCMYELKPEMVYNEICKYLEGDDRSVYQKAPGQVYGSVTHKLIEEYGDRIDAQYVNEHLINEDIWDYELVNLPVKKLLCTVFDGEMWNKLPVKETPAYRYLEGETQVYEENMRVRDEILDNNVHSVERFAKLVENVGKKGLDDKTLIVVGCDNVIKDGLHRSALWMHQYGEESFIPAIKVYRLER